MFSLIKFNFYRVLVSKLFIIATTGIILLNLIFWSVWVNLPLLKFEFLGKFFQWFSFGSIILYLSLLNIAFISNIMVSDVENGIFSLEVRKGVNFQAALWLKLGVIKLILWITLCLLTLLFTTTVLIASPVQKDLFLKGYIPGYGAFFAFDIFFTGALLLFGCTLNTKILVSISTLIAAIFALSPILGTVHFAIAYKDNLKTASSSLAALELQELAKENEKGLMRFLFDELASFDYLEMLQISKKDAEEEVVDALSFEEISEELSLEDKGIFKEIINYYLALGQPLDIANYLNSNELLGTNTKFELNEQYTQSKMYDFFKTAKTVEGIYNLKDTPFALVSKQNILGKNQLNDYFKFLSSAEVVSKLETKFKLVGVKKELLTLQSIMQNFYIENNKIMPLISEELIQSNPRLKVWTIYSNEIINAMGQNSIDNPEYLHDFTTTYENAQIHDGNQLFLLILLQLIAAPKNFKTNTSAEDSVDSVYQMIERGDSSIYGLYLNNPLISLPYMSLMSGVLDENKISSVLVNNSLIHTLNGAIYVQDVGLIPNSAYVETNSLKPFTGFDNLPISGYVVTNKVINPVWYYLVYLLLGVSFATIAHFVYIRKVKP